MRSAGQRGFEDLLGAKLVNGPYNPSLSGRSMPTHTMHRSLDNRSLPSTAPSSDRENNRLLNRTQRAATRILVKTQRLHAADVLKVTGWNISVKTVQRSVRNDYKPKDQPEDPGQLLRADAKLLDEPNSAANLNLPQGIGFAELVANLENLISREDATGSGMPLEPTNDEKAKDETMSDVSEDDLDSLFDERARASRSANPQGAAAGTPSSSALSREPTAIPNDPIANFVQGAHLGPQWVERLGAAGFVDEASLVGMSLLSKGRVGQFMIRAFPDITLLEKFHLMEALPAIPSRGRTAVPNDPIEAFVQAAHLGPQWTERLRAAGFVDADSFTGMSQYSKASVESFIIGAFPGVTLVERFFLIMALKPRESEEEVE
ncbi:hypothetical protein C8R43DRAFT_955647 [Mycena crocata]|nr:hypothetical protein C8R43DRAFT_955647 [Mycena crocata]